jgi:hypothetical protein
MHPRSPARWRTRERPRRRERLLSRAPHAPRLGALRCATAHRTKLQNAKGFRTRSPRSRELAGSGWSATADRRREPPPRRSTPNVAPGEPSEAHTPPVRGSRRRSRIATDRRIRRGRRRVVGRDRTTPNARCRPCERPAITPVTGEPKCSTPVTRTPGLSPAHYGSPASAVTGASVTNSAAERQPDLAPAPASVPADVRWSR